MLPSAKSEVNGSDPSDKSLIQSMFNCNIINLPYQKTTKDLNPDSR